MDKNKTYPLYLILSIIIFLTVTTIMTINSTYTYIQAKERIIKDIKDSSKNTIISLKDNVSYLIESYSINEYNKLIINELKNKDIFAIIVEDYNMGKIIGKEKYFTGKIKYSKNKIVNYDAKNSVQKIKLQSSFYSKSYDIINSLDNKIGKISIYISDDKINKELNKIIKETLINTLLISFLLIIFLFFIIRHFIIQPLETIIKLINNSDKDGIPIDLIPNSDNREINALIKSTNTMIKSIKKSRLILEDSEHRLEYLLELSPIAVRIAKNKGEYVIFSNNAYSKLLHEDLNHTKGKNPRDYYANKKVYDEIIENLRNKESIYNKLVKLQIQDKIVWVLASYMNIDFDGEKAVIGWFYDVTNEKENEAKLYKALELQSTIFDNSGYIMISTNKKGIIKQFNKEAEKLLNYTAEEIINKETPLIFHLKPELEVRAKKFSEELNMIVQPNFEVFITKTNFGLKNEHEWTMRSKSNEYIPVLLAITSLKNKNNEVYGYLIIGQDISQRKVMESQSKLASMGEMIGNIAHQWRQPLSIISSIASGIILQNEFDKVELESVIKDMDKIINQTSYLSKTIDDFRNFIKDSTNKESISIVSTVKKAISITSYSLKDHHITLISKLDNDIDIIGFENQLIQALINILNNSKDVLIERKEEKGRIVLVETQAIKDGLELIIRDSGGGIPEDILPKIFDPYFTTKHKSIGTGIGLAMTYQIITEHHDATIEVFNGTFNHDEKNYTGALFKITFKV